ncbi:type II toxin-antitoxin system VapB family antitoxin [Nocardioides speluncae]|uniref:type II toxin-antitoxin system VapB family antitoxin n=1 Tax=Nocardioides speluncae TaxID=2670337 RepID=UPI000D688948|nr:type II toxin-antitoxin system VapB family antitoxin [Nocardioides speluncae]
MTANISIDSDLVQHALEISGLRSEEEAVTLALEELIADRQSRDRKLAHVED